MLSEINTLRTVERIFGTMIKILIKKQLNSDPIIEFYKKGRKLSLVAENIIVMQNSTSFEVDVSLKRGRKKSKKS